MSSPEAIPVPFDSAARALSMRTLAMTLAAGGATLIVAVFLWFLVAFILPALAKDPSGEAAAFVPIFAAFILVFAALAVGGWFWSGVRRRSWFWALYVVAGALVILMFLPQISYDITHPGSPQGFIPTLLALLGSSLAIAGGIGGFLDVARGRPTFDRSGRAGVVLTAVAGLVIGAIATSSLAAGGSAGGAAVTQAPTTTGVETAKDVKFVQTAYSMKNGEVLGLFVINSDGGPHSFDIDSLNIHVSLPANSTTAVSIKPTTAGSLEFYCAIPGHKAAGMVGSIDVT